MLLVYLSLSQHVGDFLNCFAYEFIVSIFQPQIWKENACMKIKQAPKYFLKKKLFKILLNNKRSQIIRNLLFHILKDQIFQILKLFMCVYWNSYVTTLTIVLRHCFCAASSNLCRDLVFMSRQHLCWFLLQQCFLYCQHFFHYQESLSRQSLIAT